MIHCIRTFVATKRMRTVRMRFVATNVRERTRNQLSH